MTDPLIMMIAVQFFVIVLLIALLILQSFGFKEMIKQDAIADLMRAGLTLAQGIAELTPTPRDDDALIQVEGVLDTLTNGQAGTGDNALIAEATHP